VNIFTRTKTEPEPQKPIRSAALVHTELAMAEESIAPLQDKFWAAQGDLTEAQRRYDAGVQAYALGQAHIEPDRGELQTAITKSDALRRVLQQQERTVTQLSSELTQVELSEAAAAGQSRLAPLTAAAEAKIAEFESALSVAKSAEAALFTLLFDERSGMKQTFPAPVQASANQARHALRRRAEEIAQRYRFVLNPRFETDGEVNLGAEDGLTYWRQLLRR
jgi:hypothetical protein